MRNGESEDGNYIAEVGTVSCRDGIWSGNALRFDTEDAAREYVKDLACRWLAVTRTRVARRDTGAVVWSSE